MWFFVVILMMWFLVGWLMKIDMFKGVLFFECEVFDVVVDEFVWFGRELCELLLFNFDVWKVIWSLFVRWGNLFWMIFIDLGVLILIWMVFFFIFKMVNVMLLLIWICLCCFFESINMLIFFCVVLYFVECEVLWRWDVLIG